MSNAHIPQKKVDMSETGDHEGDEYIPIVEVEDSIAEVLLVNALSPADFTREIEQRVRAIEQKIQQDTTYTELGVAKKGYLAMLSNCNFTDHTEYIGVGEKDDGETIYDPHVTTAGEERYKNLAYYDTTFDGWYLGNVDEHEKRHLYRYIDNYEGLMDDLQQNNGIIPRGLKHTSIEELARKWDEEGRDDVYALLTTYNDNNNLNALAAEYSLTSGGSVHADPFMYWMSKDTPLYLVNQRRYRIEGSFDLQKVVRSGGVDSEGNRIEDSNFGEAERISRGVIENDEITGIYDREKDAYIFKDGKFTDEFMHGGEMQSYEIEVTEEPRKYDLYLEENNIKDEIYEEGSTVMKRSSNGTIEKYVVVERDGEKYELHGDFHVLTPKKYILGVAMEDSYVYGKGDIVSVKNEDGSVTKGAIILDYDNHGATYTIQGRKEQISSSEILAYVGVKNINQLPSSVNSQGKIFEKQYFIDNYNSFIKSSSEGKRNIGTYEFKDAFIKIVKPQRAISQEQFQLLCDATKDLPNVFAPQEIFDLPAPGKGQVIVMNKALGKSANSLTEEEIDNIPDAHFQAFEKTIRKLTERGVRTDLMKRSNFMYHPEKGFQFLDINFIGAAPSNKFFTRDEQEYYYAFERYPLLPKPYKDSKSLFLGIPSA